MSERSATHPWLRSVLGLVALLATGFGGLSGSFAAERPPGRLVTESAHLVPESIEEESLGSAIAMDGDWIASGAFGAVHMFRRSRSGGRAWVAAARLTRPDGDLPAFFGEAVDLDGGTLVVGAYRSLAAYLFRLDAGTDSWVEAARLDQPEGGRGAQFGWSVAIDGDLVAVGANFFDGAAFRSGAVFLFRHQPGTEDRWLLEAKLEADDAFFQDEFGRSLALQGDRLLVGAPALSNAPRGRRGRVYVFERDGTGPGGWRQVAVLVSPNRPRDQFGVAVALDGSRAAVGAPNPGPDGAPLLVFERGPGGPGDWREAARLQPVGNPLLEGRPPLEDLTGRGVALRGNLLLSGGNSHGGFRLPDGFNSGAAYLFRRSPAGGGTWTQIARLAPLDAGRDGAGVGGSLDFAGSTFVFGSRPAATVAGEPRPGAGYIFRLRSRFRIAEIGRCPGRVTFRAAGATPAGRVQVLRSDAGGPQTLQSGRCAGTRLGLAAPRFFTTVTADEEGVAIFARAVPAAECGTLVQAIDLERCAVTPVTVVRDDSQ